MVVLDIYNTFYDSACKKVQVILRMWINEYSQ